MGGRVFISYRRDDSEADAGRLYADLAREFGSDRVFKDVENVPLGGSIARQISDAIGSSAVLLLLIGPNWPVERLSNPNDWVRIEIRAALDHHVPIIPIRLRRAELPQLSQLPAELASLVDYNAAEIEHSSWQRDLVPIVEAIRRELLAEGHQPEGSDPKATEHGQWRRMPRLLVVGGLIGTTLLVVLVVAPPHTSNEGTNAPVSVADASSTTPSTVVPSTAEVIPIVIGGPLTEVKEPASMNDEGYVTFPIENEGAVTVRFTPSSSGAYVVWARVRIDEEALEPVDSNSMFVVEGDRLARSDEFVWDFWENNRFPEPGAWEWDRVSRRGATGTLGNHADNPFTIDGQAGRPTSLTFGGREPGTALERLYVTNALTWQPPECANSSVCSSRSSDP